MLSIENLAKEFVMHIGGGKRISSFRDVSFRVRKGEFLGITGPSGIGKSSLLKCIYRTYIPTKGAIWYKRKDGKRINLAEADEQTVLALRENEIGYISQFFHVIPRVTALDIVTDELVHKGFNKMEATEQAKDLLARVGISPALWDVFPSTFSGGEKQRLNIVHAVIGKPKLLLLDEPTASLDQNTKREIVSLIQELKKEGTAMVGVFHDHETLERLADIRFDLNRDQYKAVCV